MKVAYIDPMSEGNLAMYDYNLLNGLDCDVAYCCSKRYDQPKMDGVEYHPVFTYGRNDPKVVKFCKYVFSLMKLVGILRRFRPDVVHIQWWKLWRVDYWMLNVYKRHASQVVFTAHNLVPHNSGNEMVDKCRRYYERVDKIVVHTGRTKAEMMEQMGIAGEKIFVVPHGVLQAKAKREDVELIKTSLRERLGLDGKLVFSALGGQSKYKGTDVIKEAFLDSGFLEQHPDAVLLVGGRGNIIAPFIGQPQNLYVNNNRISDAEFDALLELSDVVLMPYRKISQSGVLLTAIERHIPYLATDEGGLCEPLEIAQVGWILEDDTVDSLKKSVERLLGMKEQVWAVKKDTKQWRKVEAEYDWNLFSAKYIEIYQHR